MKRQYETIGRAEQAPGTPAAGFGLIYPKTDKLWYTKDSDGVERLVNNKAPTRQVLTVGSGTYTTPAGCIGILVEGVAGGGSGGGAPGSATQAAGAGGGAAGGYFAKLIASPAATYAYTVGAGGAAPTAGANDGLIGNDTTFSAGGSLLTAKAGGGGNTGALGTTALAFSITRGGFGGAISTDAAGGAHVLAGGTDGLIGVRTSATAAIGGAGGSGPWGGGGNAKTGDGAGNAATGPGSGGSGAAVMSVNTARAGGAGADGIIIVTEYY